jgi:hypothetical protein
MKERPILFSGPMVRALLNGTKTQTRRPFYVDWRVGFREGEYADTAPWATVWSNGTWHTWDEDGVGGENGREKTPELAKAAAMSAAFRQGFLRCPLGEVGDRLWVKETWQAIHVFVDPETGYGDDMEYAKKIPKDPRQRGVHQDEIVLDTDRDYWQVVYAATDEDGHLCLEDRGFPWRPSIHMPRWASRLVLEITQVGFERLQDISPPAAGSEGIVMTNLPPTRMCWYTAQPELSAKARINGLDKTLGASPCEAFEKLWSQTYQEGPGCWEENPWVWVVCFKIVEQKARA